MDLPLKVCWYCPSGLIILVPYHQGLGTLLVVGKNTRHSYCFQTIDPLPKWQKGHQGQPQSLEATEEQDGNCCMMSGAHKAKGWGSSVVDTSFPFPGRTLSLAVISFAFWVCHTLIVAVSLHQISYGWLWCSVPWKDCNPLFHLWSSELCRTFHSSSPESIFVV